MSGRMNIAWNVAALCGVLLTAASAAFATDDTAGDMHYRRVEQQFQVPDAILTDPWGKSFSLGQELGADGPVVINFVTTTGCPDDCNEGARLFAQLQGRPNLRLISIVLNPRHETPARLRAWAKQIGAGPRWMVLSGSRRELAPVLQAFSAAEEKGSATFVHTSPKAAWVRLEGHLSAADLVRELH